MFLMFFILFNVIFRQLEIIDPRIERYLMDLGVYE